MTIPTANQPDSGSPDFFCSDCSLQMAEQQFGTSAHVDVWLVLEYNAPWRRKAVTDNDLPPEVLAHLNAPLPGLKTRLLFIRHNLSMLDRPVQFFVAVADELAPRLYGFTLADYSDLLDLDLARVAAGAPEYAAALSDERLFLVCTNGKRDRACARFGLPVYQAFETVAGEAAWQSTHLSGHRFAATALLLPHGLGCGRIALADVPHLASEYRANRLVLDLYRGRSCYPAVVQAAEYYLRVESGVTELATFRLVEAVPGADETTVVRFAAVDGGAVYTVRLRTVPEALEVFTSSADETPSPVKQHAFVAYEVAPGEAQA